jgi:hypothetical protein
MAKIRARSASAAGAIIDGPRGGIQSFRFMSCGSCLAAGSEAWRRQTNAGSRRGIFAVPTAQRHAADGGAVPEMPYGTRPERARQGAFLVLPGDGKWAGNSASAQRLRGLQNPAPVLGGIGKFTTAGKNVRLRLHAGGHPGPRP